MNAGSLLTHQRAKKLASFVFLVFFICLVLVVLLTEPKKDYDFWLELEENSSKMAKNNLKNRPLELIPIFSEQFKYPKTYQPSTLTICNVGFLVNAKSEFPFEVDILAKNTWLKRLCPLESYKNFNDSKGELTGNFLVMSSNEIITKDFLTVGPSPLLKLPSSCKLVKKIVALKELMPVYPWYFLADDSTLVQTANLVRLLEKLDANVPCLIGAQEYVVLQDKKIGEKIVKSARIKPYTQFDEYGYGNNTRVINTKGGVVLSYSASNLFYSNVHIINELDLIYQHDSLTLSLTLSFLGGKLLRVAE